MNALTGTVPPTHTVLQLSDLHIVAADADYYGTDPLPNVRAALEQIAASGLVPDALLLSGDLADTGDPAAYTRLRDTVDQYAVPRGVPVLYLMGNHDDRAALREVLLDAAPSSAPHDFVGHVRGLRIIGLDSTLPGEAYGQLSDDQLAWLAAELATPAPAGTVLALHHPPVPSPITLMRTLMLAEPERLGAVLAGSDVRIVLCGHSHHPSAGVLAGIPVWVSGATSALTNPLVTDPYTAVPGGTVTRVDVFPGHAVATAVPVLRIPTGAVFATVPAPVGGERTAPA